MLQVLNLSAQYSNKSPVYGNIVSTEGLKLAVRASSYANFIDLSPQENSLSLLAGASLKATGIQTDGKKKDVVTDYPEQDDSYTIMFCSKIDVGTRNTESMTNRYRAYIGGSFAGSGAAGGGVGIYLFSRPDTADPTKFVTCVRHVGLMKVKSDGGMSTNYVDYPIAAPAEVLPDTTGWIYGAVVFDAVTGRTEAHVLGRGFLGATRSPATYALDSVSRGQHDAVTGNRLMHHIGGFPGPDSLTNVNVVTTAEYLFFNRAFTADELQRQYSASKRFLSLARGIALP